jgi:glucose-1-phosphate cytidylyltransferase
MKAVILAGGLGTRLAEETVLRPKPMVEIGGQPILWHIMKQFSVFGMSEFVICLGYKGYVIKEYFLNYFMHRSDITVDLSQNSVQIHDQHSEPWKVTLVDTGEATMTGGRLLRVRDYLDDAPFFFTYGDGVSDINLAELRAFHNLHGKKATVTATLPPGRFGALRIDPHNAVTSFEEKPRGDGARINGGFFVLSPEVLSLVSDDRCVWEQEPLKRLAEQGELMAYSHDGFWHPMDTLRDKLALESHWDSGKAPWKLWTD